MAKTAMQELIEFSTYSSMQYPIGEMLAKAHQLLEKEKQQIKDAFIQSPLMPENWTSEHYYNETFKP